MENVGIKVAIQLQSMNCSRLQLGFYFCCISQDRAEGRPKLVSLDKFKYMSKNQVESTLKSLAIFHGSWWVWLQRQER